MTKYTKEAILQMAEEEDVEFIRLQFIEYVWNDEKYGHHRRTAGKSPE